MIQFNNKCNRKYKEHLIFQNENICFVDRLSNKLKTIDKSINNDIILMSSIEKILLRIRRNPKNVRFTDLCKICEHYFGTPRQKRSSHRVYKTPSPSDPRINIQNHGGKAKVYQVRQVLKAIKKLESENDITE